MFDVFTILRYCKGKREKNPRNDERRVYHVVPEVFPEDSAEEESEGGEFRPDTDSD